MPVAGPRFPEQKEEENLRVWWKTNLLDKLPTFQRPGQVFRASSPEPHEFPWSSSHYCSAGEGNPGRLEKTFDMFFSRLSTHLRLPIQNFLPHLPFQCKFYLRIFVQKAFSGQKMFSWTTFFLCKSRNFPKILSPFAIKIRIQLQDLRFSPEILESWRIRRILEILSYILFSNSTTDLEWKNGNNIIAGRRKKGEFESAFTLHCCGSLLVSVCVRALCICIVATSTNILWMSNTEMLQLRCLQWKKKLVSIPKLRLSTS